MWYKSYDNSFLFCVRWWYYCDILRWEIWPSQCSSLQASSYFPHYERFFLQFKPNWNTFFLAMGKMNVLPFSTLKYLYWYIHNIYFLLTKEKLKDANVCWKWWNYRFTVSSIFSLFTTNLFYDSGPCIQNSRPEFPKNWWKSATHI